MTTGILGRARLRRRAGHRRRAPRRRRVQLLTPPPDAPPLPPADSTLLTDPAWLTAMAEAFAAMFAHGVQGYVDDRLADGVGWITFTSTVLSDQTRGAWPVSQRLNQVLAAST